MQDELFATIQKVEGGELGHLEALLSLRQEKASLETSLEVIKDFESNYILDIENEAAKYPTGYRGHEIRVTPGRKTYNYDGIEEVAAAKEAAKQAEDKYRSAFDGFQKGVVSTTRLNDNDPDSPLCWVDGDGQVLPFPKLSVGKSFVTVKSIKTKK